MREIRPSGSEGGVALTTSSLPLSTHRQNFLSDPSPPCQTDFPDEQTLLYHDGD